VKDTQIYHNNFSEMFALSLSLYSPYYVEVCNEFVMLISTSWHQGNVDRIISVDVEAVTNRLL